ncbi:sulfatase [Candidatus Poribacteria bacterium]
MKKPNVVFILSDQHNAKVLGHEGHPDVKTPNLDNAITQNPICTPSRVSWLSGQYCHNHGYYGLSGPGPNGLPTILGHFRRSGYRTAAIGKIHCPEYWVEDDCDVFHDTCGTSIGGRSRKYAQYLEERGLTKLEDHGAMQEFGARGRQTVEGRQSKVSYEDGQEGWAVRQSMEFMVDCVRDERSFFLHVSLPKPHQCYTPAQEFWDLYDQSKLTLPPNADYDLAAAGKAPNLRRTANRFRTGKWQLFEPKTYEAGRLRKLNGYLGNVSHVDHSVGELLGWLRENNLEEDTIVIYSSDHGDYACEHGILEKAPGICSDAITRIPWIWRWPGRLKAGHKADEIVETVDMVNTVCALTDMAPLETADGKDISHLLRGGNGEVHDVGVTEFAWSKSVRKGKYRLVCYPLEMFPEEYPDGFGELYDLEADPWEMKNLYFEQEFPEVVHDLERELIRWLVTTTRPVTALPHRTGTGDQVITRYNNSVNADGKINPENIKSIAGSNYI